MRGPADNKIGFLGNCEPEEAGASVRGLEDARETLQLFQGKIMARKVAVLFVHGIRTDGQHYSTPFRDAVRRKLPKALRGSVVFEEVVWSDIVRGKQTNYLDQLEAMGLRPKAAFREFVIQGLGDAAAYTKGSSRAGVYYEIQDRIHAKLALLESQADPERPLVIVAHSLGCHIVSSLLWDVRKLRHLSPDQRGNERYSSFKQDFDSFDQGTPLRRLETISGLVTFGNNMPIFAFSYPGADIFTVNRPHGNMPAAFPGERVQGAALKAARWINIYSRRDPLGYPLKPLSANYADDDRIEDVPYPVEGIFSPPFFGMLDAHTKYWRHRYVVKRTSDLVEKLIQSA